MVQVLPQRTGHLGSALGESFNQGFQSSLAPALQRQYDIGMTNQGLDQAQKSAEAANGDPVKLAFALARSASYSPQLERAIGPLFSELMKYGGNEQFNRGLNKTTNNDQNPQAPGQIGTNNASMPSMNGTQTNVEENIVPLPKSQDAMASNLAQKYRPEFYDKSSPYGRVRTFDHDMKSALRPNEEAQIRTELGSNGIRSPEAQSAIIDKINKDIGTRFAENQQAYQYSKEEQEQINNKWSTVKNDVDGILKPYTGTYETQGKSATARQLKDKFFEYAAKEPTNLTPEQIEANAMNKLQSDINNLQQLESLPIMGLFHTDNGVNEYLKNYREAAQPLIDADMEGAVREDALLNKDMGLQEYHQMRYGDQTSKDSMDRLKIDVRSYEKDERQSYKYVDKLAKQLVKIKPEDDLMILRGVVLANGGDEQDFSDALRQAQENGLELSPFQQRQVPETQQRYSPGLWEYFSPGHWTQGFAPDAFFKKAGYLRGKR